MDELNRLKRELAQSQYGAAEEEAKKRRRLAATVLGLALPAEEPRNTSNFLGIGVPQNGNNLSSSAGAGIANLQQQVPAFASLPGLSSSTASGNQQMTSGIRPSMFPVSQQPGILQLLNNRAMATAPAPSLTMQADLSGLAAGTTTTASQLRTDALLAEFTAQSAADAAALMQMNASGLLRAKQQEDVKLRAMVLFNQLQNGSSATAAAAAASFNHNSAWSNAIATGENSLLDAATNNQYSNTNSAASAPGNLQRPPVAFDHQKRGFLSSLQGTDGTGRSPPQSEDDAKETPLTTKDMASQKDPSPTSQDNSGGTGTAVASLKMPPQAHHGECTPLGIEEDNNWLSEMHCFLRSEIVEVFHAEKASKGVGVKVPTRQQQVGIRCRWCANVSSDSRVGRSSAFPSSLRQLYQSFTMMVRDHFGPSTMCQAIPAHLRERLNRLRCSRISQGASDSKHYWIYAAKKIGMVDTDHRGIKITPDSQAAGSRMPCFGSSEDTTSNVDAESNRNKEQLPTVLLVQPSDIPKASMFLYTLLLQTQLVHLQPSERVAKRKTLPLGLEGIGCRHCFAAGRFGFSRRFPLRRRCLSEEVKDIHSHMVRCPLCPQEVKQLLEKLHVQHENATGAGQNSKDGRGKDPYREFFDTLWGRLGRVNDIKT